MLAPIRLRGRGQQHSAARLDSHLNLHYKGNTNCTRLAAHDVADADATDDVDDEQAAVIRFAWMQQQQQQQEQQQPYVADENKKERYSLVSRLSDSRYLAFKLKIDKS